MAIKDKPVDEQRKIVEEMCAEMESRGTKVNKPQVCAMMGLVYNQVYGTEEAADETPAKAADPPGDDLMSRIREDAAKVNGPVDLDGPEESKAEESAEPDPEPAGAPEAPVGEADAPEPPAPETTDAPPEEDPLADLAAAAAKAEAPAPAKERAEVPADDFMSMLDDLRNLEVSGSSEGRLRVLASANKAEPAHTASVACLGAGYLARMGPLNMVEKKGLRTVDPDKPHLIQSKLYRSIYDHIVECSPPKPNFQKWLEITTLADVDTLLFGLYAATYRGRNRYPVRCPHCGHQNMVEASPAELVKVENDEVRDRVTRIARSAGTYEDLKEISLLGKQARVSLPEAKLVVTLSMPSLARHLDVTRQVPREDMEEVYQHMVWIREIHVLDPVESKAAGRPVFQSYNALKDMVTLLAVNMRDDDEEIKLYNEIESLADDTRVKYRVGGFNCAGIGCGRGIEPTEVDLARSLFTRLMRA